MRGVITVALAIGILLPVAQAKNPEPAPDNQIDVEESETSTALPEMIVTAGRTLQPQREIAAQTEVITELDIERSGGFFAVDFLKNNASVDVIQYPGGLSGIGLRGFRPEFSGTNQRVLVLIDGRPAGVTSLGNLSMAGVTRVEVVKGSSSAVYGSSAMGGVVNFITQRTGGPLAGQVRLGGGSFNTFLGDASIGGDLGNGFDMDLFVSQRSRHDDYRVGSQETIIGDFRQGGGVRRPNTTFTNRSVYGRLGYEINDNWRTDLRLSGFFSHPTDTPGSESAGQSAQGSSDTDAYSVDFSLTGVVDRHGLSFRAFSTREDVDNFQVQLGQRGILNRGRDTRFRGLQLRDTWRLSDTNSLTYGIDYELVGNTNTNFNNQGQQIGPFSPDDERRTLGTYLELTTRQFGDRLIANIGGRHDQIRNKVLDTPFRPDLEPGSSSFSTFNPRLGLVVLPQADGPLRIHASVGRGFVAPLTRQVSGRTEEFSGSQRILGLSNPDLSPERSTTYDLGVGYQARQWGADLTYFRTDVRDKIESIILTNTPELRESTWINASSARADGLEATLQGGIEVGGGKLGSTLTSTYFFTRDQDLPAGPAPLRNVARFKASLSLDADYGPFGGRILLRHVRGMQDADFSVNRIFTGGAGGLFTYPSLTLFDLHASWQLSRQHQLSLQINNLFDRYYYEKNDFPGPGRAAYASYRFLFF